MTSSVVRSNFLKYQLPALLWILMIFFSSSIPSRDLPEIKIVNFDKAVHLVIFFLLSLLTHRAVRYQKRFPMLVRHDLLFTILFTTLYGLVDEFHQYFVPGRNSSLYDLLADCAGACAYSVLFSLLQKRSV